MKILIIGATGTIGSTVVKALDKKYEVIPASRNSDVSVDIDDSDSIVSMYRSLPKLDAVISISGNATFGSLDDLSDDDFTVGLKSKLMGQVNLVRFGRAHLNDGGSFTLTSGILALQPQASSVMLTMINSGVEGFVRSAALGLPRGLRLNAVSPPMVKETAKKLGWGDGGVPAAEVALDYVKALEGAMTGRVLASF